MVNLIPNEFIKFKPPNSENDWAGHSLLAASIECAFDLAMDGSSLSVTRRNASPHECCFDVPEGTITGVSNGEFGGWLHFERKDGGTIEYLREDAVHLVKVTSTYYLEPIIGIFEYENKLLCLTGICHLGFRHGALLEITDYLSERIHFSVTLYFDDAPESYAIYNGKIFIVAAQSLYIIKDDFSYAHLFKDGFWGNLYPSSIAVYDEENILFGIRGGIVKINAITEECEFYLHESLKKKYICEIGIKPQ